MPRKKSKKNNEINQIDAEKSGKEKMKKKSQQKNEDEKDYVEEDIENDINDKEKDIENEDELNIDSLSDLEDLDEWDDSSEVELEEEDYFVSEDDLIICPNCGEVIEVERLRLLEECPSCGLKASEFEQINDYDYIEKDEDDEW